MRFFLVLLTLSALVALGESKSKSLDFGEPGSDGFINKIYDVATGRRELKIKGSVLDGSLEVTTSYTTEEYIYMAAAGIALLLALMCCCACLKSCCCPSKPPSVILYQQMPNPQPAATVIPMGMPHGQGFPQTHSSSRKDSPPPYPGFPV